MTNLVVGAEYPLPLLAEDEGLSVQLLTDDNLLQVCLEEMSYEEIMALKTGPISAFIAVKQPVILLAFKFGDELILDCPFDARLIPSNELKLPSVTAEQHSLALTMHGIDIAENSLQAVRTINLDHQLTVEFLSAVQDQLALPLSKKQFLSHLDILFNQIELESVEWRRCTG